MILRWAYKHVREIARRMEFYRGEVEHPNFLEGSQAATQRAGTSVEISASKIVYSKEDDDVIDEFHRRTGSYNLKWIFAAPVLIFDIQWERVIIPYANQPFYIVPHCIVFLDGNLCDEGMRTGWSC